MLLALSALALAGCGSTHPLPPYETPLAHTNVQWVRTTAYTHTESDHLAYGNHNALGGTLRAAEANNGTASSPNPGVVAPPAPAAMSAERMQTNEEGGFHPPATGPANPSVLPGSGDLPPGQAASPGDGQWPVPTTGVGSAAADWSRWPAGTVFRVEATGQVYEVDDYGWALAGRNTIDLYQPTRGAMNVWGTRQVNIEVLRWGDPGESLRRLRRHQEYRHIHRMVLELEGKSRAAAALE